MKIKCDSCGNRIRKPGAILLSPPKWRWWVKKYHLCRKCYNPPKRRSNLDGKARVRKDPQEERRRKSRS